MDVRGVDPRDTAWEDEEPRYRVYCWDRRRVCADEYEVRGAADVDEVLAWARARVTERAEGAEGVELTYTVYVLVEPDGPGRPGLVRLAGVRGDPFA
ncbi:hypothetical protein [Streptomyces sp. NPDC048172]|uniref:hypothetical protein n=1 Tax=Streptomyces sp. NPDC048172 TaxID=3365505 RepID=UPI0037249236